MAIIVDRLPDDAELTHSSPPFTYYLSHGRRFVAGPGGVATYAEGHVHAEDARGLVAFCRIRDQHGNYSYR